MFSPLQGYTVVTRTWEHDVPEYQTRIVSGLTEADAYFYVDLAYKFRANIEPRRFYYTDEALYAIVNSLLETHNDVSLAIKHSMLCGGETDIAWRINDDLLGFPISNGNATARYCRVVTEVKVFFSPEESHDVTDRFRMWEQLSTPTPINVK